MTITAFARRMRWYLRALGSNPLIRKSDRLEAFAALAVLATAVLAVPAAAQAGSHIYDTGVRAATAQTLHRHPVEAVATDGSVSMPTDFDSSATVRVQWREGTSQRTAQITIPGTVKAGEPLKIWLDDTGKVVAAPLTSEDVRLRAVAATGAVWLLLVASSAVAAFLVRRRLDRWRDRAWERELQLMAHNDDGWANRQI